nr:hypothetical protein [Tanacetum cinerariifolium]
MGRSGDGVDTVWVSAGVRECCVGEMDEQWILGIIFQGEGSTVPVESHYTPTDEVASTGVDVRHGGATTIVTNLDTGQGSGNIDKTPSMPYDLPLPRVNTLGSDESINTGSDEISTTSRIVSTAKESVSTDGASMPVSTASMIDKERQRIARVHEAAQTFIEEEWENIRARVEADEELTQRLQVEERDKYSEVDQAKMLVDLINQRQRYFAAKRVEERRNKPMTQAQQRTYMSNYIKNIGIYTLKQLRKLSFDEIDELFKETMRSINDFVPMESKDDKAVPKLAEARSSKRDAEEELKYEGSKKENTSDALGSAQEQPGEEEKELSQEDLQQLMIIVLEQRMNVEALQTKYPIIDWEIYTEDTRKYWKIIRVGNHTEVYQFFEDMLKIFDNDDLVMLWSLVKERFSSTEPTDNKEKVLWVELKRLFEPDTEDELWELQSFFIIAVQTPGSGISILLAVGTPSTGSGNLYCQWELSPGSGNALCILFPTILP